MGYKVLGGFFILMAAIVFSGVTKSNASGAVFCVVLAAAFGAIGLRLILKKGKTPEEKEERRKKKEALAAAMAEQKEIKSRTVLSEHAAGLPLRRGVSCSVRFDEECISIDSSGVRFKIAYGKVTEMQVTTSTEIKKHYVSDAGGAVAGNEVLGPLGAVLFGGVQEVTDRTVSEFLVITYVKDGRVEYAAFLIPRKEERMKAEKLVRQYRRKMSGKIISFDL